MTKHMAAQLGTLQFIEARRELAARLEQTTMKSLLGGKDGARKAALWWAIQKTCEVFARLRLDPSRVEKLVIWEMNGTPQEVVVKAGPSEWKWSIPLFEKVEETVVKAMPTATPKRADGSPALIITRESVLAPAPKVTQPDAVRPVARKGTCEGCPEGMAAFAVEAKGKGLRALCTGCHEVARADKASFVEAIAI